MCVGTVPPVSSHWALRLEHLLVVAHGLHAYGQLRVDHLSIDHLAAHINERGSHGHGITPTTNFSLLTLFIHLFFFL